MHALPFSRIITSIFIVRLVVNVSKYFVKNAEAKIEILHPKGLQPTIQSSKLHIKTENHRNYSFTLEFWHLLKIACWFSDGIRTSSTWNPPKSQILTAPSSEPEAKRSPSGDKAKDLILDLCPVNRCKTSPDRTSHTY